MADEDDSGSESRQCPLPAAPESHTIRQLHKSESRKAALTLAEAFVDDNLARYFVDTPDGSHWSAEEKWELHLSIMQYITYAHCLKGIVTTIGPNYDSVALW